MVRSSVGALVVVLAAARPAGAGGELDLTSPRAVGHAGASLVSDDGAAALFACPAAVARRDVLRAQLGSLVIDDDVWLDSSDHPRVGDRGPSELVPLVGAQGRFGPLIVAAGYARTESLDRRLPVPDPGLPADTVIEDYPHRHAGTSAHWQRSSVAAGAAVRVADWLAVGASVTLSQVDAGESRRVWAGFGGRDGLGAPGRDVVVTVDGGDGLVPGGALGVMIAPLDAPIEVAVGAAWSDDVRATGSARVAPVAEPPSLLGAPSASARFASPLVAQAGVRWLGARYAIELDATLWTYPRTSDGWTVSGARLVDESGAIAGLTTLPTRLGRRSHGAVAAALDAEVLPGFLWLSAGYAWRGAGAATWSTTTVGADPGGHTVAIGAELSAGAAVVTVGIARQLTRTTEVSAPGLPWDNPFPGGTAPANLGRHGHSRDVVGVAVELRVP